MAKETKTILTKTPLIKKAKNTQTEISESCSKLYFHFRNFEVSSNMSRLPVRQRNIFIFSALTYK